MYTCVYEGIADLECYTQDLPAVVSQNSIDGGTTAITTEMLDDFSTSLDLL